MDYRFTFANSVDSDDPLSLAEVLEHSPKSSVHLSLQHRNLARIGQLRSRYHMLQSIDLSHNELESLRGLSVLTVLKTGIFCSNRLSSFKALGDLSELRHLTTLDLRSNKVAMLTSYKITVLSSIPSLEQLDSQSVRANDKKAAQRHRSLTEEVAKNEEIYLRLEHLKSKLRVHRQMIISSFVIDYVGVDVDRYLKMVPYVHGCDEVKDWVCQRMTEENNEFTLTDCIQDQHERIQELKGICYDLSKECITLFNAKFGEEDEMIALYVPRRERRSASRVEMLDDRLNYVKIKNEDTFAIQNAIKEGINTVVERFISFNLAKKVFNGLRNAVKRCKVVRCSTQNAKEKRLLKILKKGFEGWKQLCKESREDKRLQSIGNKFDRKRDSEDEDYSGDNPRKELVRNSIRNSKDYDKNSDKAFKKAYGKTYDINYDKKYGKYQTKLYGKSFRQPCDEPYEESYRKSYNKSYEKFSNGKTHGKTYDESQYTKYHKNRMKSQKKPYEHYTDKTYNEFYNRKPDNHYEQESESMISSSSRSSEKKYSSVSRKLKDPRNYKLEMNRYEHQRLLQYASFHQKKKMKSKIFQGWKDYTSSNSHGKSEDNYKTINNRLNNLERSLNETKQELESSLHLRTMGAHSPAHRKFKDDFLTSSHCKQPQHTNFRSFTPLRRPNSQIGQYSGTRTVNQHLEHRILNADRQVALRTNGSKLIEDIYQKLDTLETKLLTRHRIYY